jgi:hypothetical protein
MTLQNALGFQTAAARLGVAAVVDGRELAADASHADAAYRYVVTLTGALTSDATDELRALVDGSGGALAPAQAVAHGECDSGGRQLSQSSHGGAVGWQRLQTS